mgnify:CR=1 FL=1
MTKMIRIAWISLMLIIIFASPIFARSTVPIRDSQGEIIPGSIAELKKVELGGIEQYIMLRGRDRTNPVLLFLHGGPGYPQISYIRHYQSELERHFVVVNWDQRGSGLSYSEDIPAESMTVDTLLSDTYQLVELLCERFNQDQIFLVGHSYGSYLGILMVDRHPELFEGYVGIGQMSNDLESERLSYRYTLKKAREEENTQAINQLEEIGPPPYQKDEDFDTQRKWLKIYSESDLNIKNITIRNIIFSPEYNWLDSRKFIQGAKFTRKTMYDHAFNINLFEEVKEVDIPIYFCLGKKDYGVPFEFSAKYFNFLKAPEKKIFWFPESGHYLHLENQEKFAQIMLTILRKVE